MKYLKVFTDFRHAINILGEAERGRLFTAMLEYAETGESAELRGNERALFEVAKIQIDSQRLSYNHRCEVNRGNVNSRYEKELRIVTSRNESYPIVTSRNESYQDKDKDKDKERSNLKITKKERSPLEIAIDDFKEHRRKLRSPMTERALTLMLNELDRLASTDDEKIAIINQSIANGYKGVFPLKKEERKVGRAGMGANAGYKQTALTEADFASMFVDLDKEIL